MCSVGCLVAAVPDLFKCACVGSMVYVVRGDAWPTLQSPCNTHEFMTSFFEGVDCSNAHDMNITGYSRPQGFFLFRRSNGDMSLNSSTPQLSHMDSPF